MTEQDRKERFAGNQGEGNREAARDYNQQQRRFVEQGRVEESAERAKQATESGEKSRLEQAEREGKSHAKEFDPNVKRDNEERRQPLTGERVDDARRARFRRASSLLRMNRDVQAPSSKRTAEPTFQTRQ